MTRSYEAARAFLASVGALLVAAVIAGAVMEWRQNRKKT